MPFKLHPSGYCSFYTLASKDNLVRGFACPFCGRVAGHQFTCQLFSYDEIQSKSSRSKFFDASAILLVRSPDKSFITFTLPSIQEGTYQRSADCPTSGDTAVGSYFSKCLEAWKLRAKRNGHALSYVWVAEAQMKRQLKFGGIGDIHYHLIVNQKFKHNNAKKNFTPWGKDEHDRIQNSWCSAVGVHSSNAVHIDPLPDGINSVPAYLAKYLGKGSQRKILSRRFQCTRDLSVFLPITTSAPPDCTLLRRVDSMTPTGFEFSVSYYDTQEVLESYGHHMKAEWAFKVSRTDQNFTNDKIIGRAIARSQPDGGSSYST